MKAQKGPTKQTAKKVLGGGKNDFKCYIASQPPPVRPLLAAMARSIADAVPDAEPCLRYGIPTFRLEGRNMLHFGAFTRHIGFYPTTSGMAAFRKELARFEQSRGTVRFPFGKRLPLGLVKRVAKFRAGEIRGQA